MEYSTACDADMNSALNNPNKCAENFQNKAFVADPPDRHLRCKAGLIQLRPTLFLCSLLKLLKVQRAQRSLVLQAQNSYCLNRV